MNIKSLVAFLSLALYCAASARGQTLEWIQYDTIADEGCSADGLGYVYVCGSGASVSKYDASGTLQWTQHLVTSESNTANGVSADGIGNVYISGISRYGDDPATDDGFVRKYDASGTLQWNESFGSSERDGISDVSADSLGNIFISGRTLGGLGGPNSGGYDAFLSKYDASGTLQWTQQLGTSEFDGAPGVSADGIGNVYIAGGTGGSLGGPNFGGGDAFVSKYNASGTLQWTQQFGTSEEDESRGGVSADGLGNVYISGFTSGSMGGPNIGNADAFLSKYDASGSLQWTRQLGTSGVDISHDVSADALGNVYISGVTEGSLGGANAGGFDVFVSKYDASGTLHWTQQFGTSGGDFDGSVSADGLGNVYISGVSDSRGFVAKFVDLTAAPEPSGVLLLLAALGLSLTGPISRNAPRAD